MLRSNRQSLGNPCSQPWRRKGKATVGRICKKQLKTGISPEEEKEGYGGKDLQKRKVLSLEWKSEGVMDDKSGWVDETNGKCHSLDWVNQNCSE